MKSGYILIDMNEVILSGSPGKKVDGIYNKFKIAKDSGKPVIIQNFRAGEYYDSVYATIFNNADGHYTATIIGKSKLFTLVILSDDTIYYN